METITEKETKDRKRFQTTQNCARFLKVSFPDGTFNSEKIPILQTQKVSDVQNLEMGDWIIIQNANGKSQFISITNVRKTEINADQVLTNQAKTWKKTTALTYQPTPPNKNDAPENNNRHLITYKKNYTMSSSDPIEISSAKFFTLGEILKIL